MPRRKTLTDSMVIALPPKPAAYSFPDPEMSGLYVRVQPTGTKKFVAVTRTPDGTQKWITLGSANVYSIAEAREKAREAIKATREGKSQARPETIRDGCRRLAQAACRSQEAHQERSLPPHYQSASHPSMGR